MLIGVPKEIKDSEFRVSLTPEGAESLAYAGHKILVQSGAGLGSGFTDDQYREASAHILPTAADVYGQAEMILKVKEPLPSEYSYLRPGLLLFTYLHLAANQELTQALVDRQVTSIAYETVQLPNGSLPLLTPMSEVAGRMAVQIGAHYLQKTEGGRGILLGGVPGTRSASVVIIGGGTVGINATQMALGMGARVTVIDLNLDRLRYLDQVFCGNLSTIASNRHNIAEAAHGADLIIGAVLQPGAKAPLLVTEDMVATIAPGSVIVDVAVDQGGCIETIHSTSHSAPTYTLYRVTHYAVPNIPGVVPRTSTYALSNATLPYVLKLASAGLTQAVQGDPALWLGVNTYAGRVTYQAVAAAFDMEYTPLEQLL